MRLEEELFLAADLTPEKLSQFQRDLPTEWIEEALYSTGTATVRRRRLPAEQVVWLVLAMALMRDRPIADVVDKLDLALPNNGKRGGVTPAPTGTAGEGWRSILMALREEQSLACGPEPRSR